MPRVLPRPEVAEGLAAIELPSIGPGGERPIRFDALWADAPVVVVHLRHFGCILCRHYAVQLQAVASDFEAAQVKIVAVGTGGRAYAREFIDKRGLTYPVLVDKFLQSHDVIGTRSGPFVGILKPRVVASAVRAVAAGQMQGKTGPHPFVFGAAHVFARGGQLRYAWLNHDYNDNAPLPDLLAAATA